MKRCRFKNARVFPGYVCPHAHESKRALPAANVCVANSSTISSCQLAQPGGCSKEHFLPNLTWYSHNCREKMMNTNALNRSSSLVDSDLLLFRLLRTDQNVHGGAVWTQRGCATIMIAQMSFRVECCNTSHVGNFLHDALLTRLWSMSMGGPTTVKPPEAGSKPPGAGSKPPEPKLR